MDTLKTAIGTIWGYGFAIIVGHFVIKYIVDGLWKNIGWRESNYEERPFSYMAGLVRIPVKSHAESGACRTVGRWKTLVTLL